MVPHQPRIMCADILEGRQGPRQNKETVTRSVMVALLKRRIATYCINKFKSKDEDGVVYEENRSPSKVLQLFNTMAGFRDSKLHDSSARASLSWLGRLPSFQVDIIAFLGKMLRGHALLDSFLDKCVAKDALMPAETTLSDPDLAKGNLIDVQSLLALKKEFETLAQPVPVAEVPKEVPQPTSEAPPQPSEADEEMPANDTQAEPEDVVEPQRLDRLKWFSKLCIPDMVISVLEKHDDSYYEIVDWVHMRVRAFLKLEVKGMHAKNLKEQLLAVKSQAGGPCLVVLDVKARLRMPADDILHRPFRRAVPLEQSSFRKMCHAIWNDTSKEFLGMYSSTAVWKGILGNHLLDTCYLRKQEKMAWGPEDTVLLLDGRNPCNFDAMTKELLKVFKNPEVSSLLPARKCPPNVHARGRVSEGTFVMVSVDPLENMIHIASKSAKLPRRASVVESITRDNFSRAWTSLGTKAGFRLCDA